jgi:light-regulated signal transduction histidine kinase (bacteriophytochrome)
VFSRSDVDFLQAVANVLSLALKCQQAEEALYEVRANLNQTTTALERRNSELDQFAYVTSHDLKAPLRAIANLSQWIEDDISDQLNEENLHQLQLLRGRVHRLEALIDALLQYSRAGRIKAQPQEVDVEALLKQVIETLRPPAQFTIEVTPGMPTLVTEQWPLQQVFTHLIENAIKHHPQAHGTVKISVKEQSNAYEFAVADDGAGIAPQFHERVFVIFQTLQARDTVENTGIGLAIVKRIVESKGGTIRLESQEGQGATVCFTWPK